MSKRPRIFVSIASYRDPECQRTVKDLFEKASYPERIFVGICWQYDPKTDMGCFSIKPPFPEQMRVKPCHPEQSLGSSWARAQALSLARDEEFTLQIDAHMRFAQGWDEMLIKAYRDCPTKRAVLTAHAPNFDPPDMFEDCSIEMWTLCVHQLGDENDMQPVHLGKIPRKWKDLPKKPYPVPFLISNFIFAPTEIFRAVPYDPYIFFRGQESVYSARLWTHGVDIFQIPAVILYHYWGSPPRGGATYKQRSERADISKERVMHLLGVELARDQRALHEIGLYGMGRARDLADFWEYAGVNLRTRKIETKAAKGTWPPYKSGQIELSASLRLTYSLDMKHGSAVAPRPKRRKKPAKRD